MFSFLSDILAGKNARRISQLLAAISLFSVTALYYTQNPFLEAFEAKTYDLRFKNLRGPIPSSPDIAIIAIDDKSISELGRFPWTRTQYVKLLDRLATVKARAILFDAFFPEPESAAVDQAFAAAIRRSGNVILARSYDLKQLQVSGKTHSLPVIERSAKAVAHINFLPEDDGVNRRNLLLIEDQGKLIPSLGMMGGMAALGEKDFSVAPFSVKVGQRNIPVDGDNAMWINFTGPAGSYPYYSFSDILKGRVAPEKLKGKILFVGATALGIYDMRVTPYSGNVPGVEVHAAVADDIISGRFIHRSGLEALFDIAMIIALGTTAFILTMRIRLYGAIPATILLASAYIWFSYMMFLQGHWVSMIYPPLSAAVALLIGGGFRYLVLERSARVMRTMFSSYLSHDLVAQLEKNPDAAKIGGDNREVTVLFTDIKSFTTFSENHSAQEVVSRLNEYLDSMVDVIHRHDGTVDKFIGDGIMAYWGAPIPQAEHAKHAVACALDMKKTMRALTEEWKLAGVEPFEIRGGIQSGEVVAGNIGSSGKKMEYTVIGDTVNQASRFEGTAKYYGVKFLVGENTFLKTCDSFRYREIDKVRVVGKRVPVAVYELLDTLQAPPDELTTRFNQALALCHDMKWTEAAQQFAAIQSDFPDDTASSIYLERCKRFVADPPPEGWDGVYNRLDK